MIHHHPSLSHPASIDIDEARQKYQALLAMRSVAKDSIGKYPTFDEFCDYLRINHVQVDFDKRVIKRILIAGDNFKLNYAFVA